MSEIRITETQLKAAKKAILDWFPGQENKEIRRILREQLLSQSREIQGVEPDPFFPPRVKLGYGVFLLQGEGDRRTRSFNADVNQALGL